jgi:hypothetical protein
MPLFITHAVEHNPKQQNAAGHDSQAMPLKKCLPGFPAQGKLQIVTPIRLAG